MRLLTRLWKRHVTGRPDRYQAYVAFPTADDRPAFADVHARIEELEHVFEGRLDVYPRLRSVAVVSDRVPADRFDVAAFESALDRVEELYAGTHSIARLEKWRLRDDQFVKSYVVVPVKPLYPPDEADRPEPARSPVR